MKVTTSCSGRFWIFDQALQLFRHGILHQLINDYPKQFTRRWGIPDYKVVSLVANGILGRIVRLTPNYLGVRQQRALVKRHHDWFSRRVMSHLPLDSDIFIGLSSFCLEALKRARQEGIVTFVDHGSLHQRAERRLLEEEAQLQGLPLEIEFAPEWIIEKEDQEFHAADGILVLSEAAKRTLVEEGIDERKVFVNACGVDLSQFVPAAKDKVDEHGRPVFRIIYCGNISLRKGVHYLLQAFVELRLDNAELWLVGSAPAPAYARLISKHCTDKVRFLGTFAQGDLQPIYAQGSVCVLPSLADGFGMVVPQAMACGLPVIVTENVGAADIVQDGVEGFVVPIRDVAALKERLLVLYEDALRREQMGTAALATAHARLSWDSYGDRLVDYLRSYSQPSSTVSDTGRLASPTRSRLPLH